MGGSTLLIASIACAALLAGLVPTLVQGLQQALGQRFALDEAHARRLVRWLMFAFVPCLFLGGLIVDSWGVREVLFFGLFLMSLGLAGLGLSQSYRSARWTLAGVGVASGFVLTACLFLMAHPFDVAPTDNKNAAAGAEKKNDDEKVQKKTLWSRLFPLFQPRGPRDVKPPYAQRLNLGFIFLGLGGLLGMWLAPLVGKISSLRQRLLGSALLCLAAAAVVAVTPGNDFPTSSSSHGLNDLAQDPGLWMAGVIALLYFPLEGSFSTWAQTYLQDKDLAFRPRAVTLLIVCFWAVFLAARLLTAWLLPTGWESGFGVILALLIGITLGNLSGTFNRTNGALAFLFVAACAGPFVPTFLSVAGAVPPDGRPLATALGGLYAIGMLGCLVLQHPLRTFAQSHSIRATLRIPMILALILCVPALVLALIRN